MHHPRPLNRPSTARPSTVRSLAGLLLAGLLLAACGGDDTTTADPVLVADDAGTTTVSEPSGAETTVTTTIPTSAATETTPATTADTAAATSAPADGELDILALHELDDALNAGTLDAAAQRPVVAGYIAQLEAAQPAEGTPQASLLVVLRDLDAALAVGDISTAAPLATQAHGLAHRFSHHD